MNEESGAHLYYYDNNLDTEGAFWQLDDSVDVNLAGAQDKHNGGRWKTVSCSNYLWDLNQWHWLDDQDAPISVLLKNVNDGLEYVKVWDHPEDFFNDNYFRQGYYNAKPRFITQDGDGYYKVLYHFVSGVGINPGTGYWQFDWRD